jgi:isoleucyl-tRNA synthetase
MSEEIYQRLVQPDVTSAPASVHLLDYPEADTALIDSDLEMAMAAARTVVNLGRGLRKRNDLRVRQPLGLVTIVSRDPRVAMAVEQHRDLIAEELNVHRVEVHDDEADLVVLSAKADFKRLGPKLGKETGAVAGEIASLDHPSIAALLEGEHVAIRGITLTADDIVVTRTPHEGTVVATEGDVTVALDTTLTDDLRTEGVARELVNRIQLLRRADGLDVTSRIMVRWASDSDPIVRAFHQFGDFIAGEVLARAVERVDNVEADTTDIDGLGVSLSITSV